MGFIFAMSSDLGSSAHTSLIIEPVILWINPHATPEEIEEAHFLVRKSGHISEYAVLGFLIFRAMKLSRPPAAHPWSWRCAGVSLLIATAYAASDEWHQSFVPGRTAAVHDVIIDSCGALIGLSLVFKWCKVTAFSSSRQTAPPATR